MRILVVFLGTRWNFVGQRRKVTIREAPPSLRVFTSLDASSVVAKPPVLRDAGTVAQMGEVERQVTTVGQNMLKTGGRSRARV
jgi:hypothetical protein